MTNHHQSFPAISAAELADLQKIVGRPLTSDEAQQLLHDTDLRARILLADPAYMTRFTEWLNQQEGMTNECINGVDATSCAADRVPEYQVSEGRPANSHHGGKVR